jgi:hypothetical protein
MKLLIIAATIGTGCVTTTTKPPEGIPAEQPGAIDPAIAKANAFADALVRGNLDEIQAFYDDRAMLVGPNSLTPLTSKEAIVNLQKTLSQREKTVYFHLRQPRAAQVDAQTAVVVANYEHGAQGASLTETNGKILFVLSGGPSNSIAAEVIVPNVNAGTYGPMGTAMTARPWGRFPSKAVPPPGMEEEPRFNTAWEKDLFDTTRKINATFPKGSVDAMLAFADERVSIWAGDYGPVYIWGMDAARKHFADFFRSGKMGEIRAFRPVIRDYGGARMVYFQFEETLEVERQMRRNPGQATYLFTSKAPFRLMACSETAIVAANIGDPYDIVR